MVMAPATEQRIPRFREAVTTNPPQAQPALPVFTRGLGPWLFTADGQRYFDCTSGSGAVSLGHQYPAVVEAVVEQVRTLGHTGCKLISDRRCEMVQALGALSPFADCRVIPAVTGAEAVEVALKVMRAASGRRTVIAFEHSFHGKTSGALSVTWRRELAQYSPLPDGAVRTVACPTTHDEADEDRCLTELQTTLKKARLDGAPVAGAIFEAVQTTEGIYPGSRRFLSMAVQLVRAAEGLVAFDEIYTGFGRAGARFYADVVGVTPDVLIVGKSLGNGFPISAVLGPAAIIDAIPPGVQTSTFSGNPVGAAAALAVMSVFNAKDLPARARAIGERLTTLLGKSSAHGVGHIRHAGALVGFDLLDRHGQPSSARAKRFAQEAANRRLLIFQGGANGASVKLVPPLLLDDDALGFLLETLENCIAHVDF